MTLFYSHQERLRDASGISLWAALARRAIGGASAVLTCVHQAILAAKTRRMQRELMFHDSGWDGQALELDPRDRNVAAKFPQAPLILGDKWDF